MKITRRRCLLLVVIASLVSTSLLGWFVLTRESPNLQRFRQIKVGMPLEDVKRLFPTNGRGVPWPYGYEWVFDDESVMVMLDAEERVTAARYWYAPDPNRWFAVVLRWVGIDRTYEIYLP